MLLVVVPVLVLFAVIVSLSITRTSRPFSDALVNFFFPYLNVYGFLGRQISKFILALSSWISNRLGRVFLEGEHYAVSWFGALAWYVRFAQDAALWPGQALIQVTRWLVGTEIPHLIRSLPNSVTRIVHDGAKITNKIARTVYRDIQLSKAAAVAAVTAAFPGLVLDLPMFKWLRQHLRLVKAAALAAAVTIPIATGLPWFGGWTPTAIRRRLHKVEPLLGVTAFAAIMARVLHVTPRCLRDGNVGRSARALCGAPTKFLEDLLGIFADIWLLENVCVLIGPLETVAADVGAPLVIALTDVTAGLCKHSIGKPAAVRGPALTFPPVEYVFNVVTV